MSTRSIAAYEPNAFKVVESKKIVEINTDCSFTGMMEVLDGVSAIKTEVPVHINLAIDYSEIRKLAINNISSGEVILIILELHSMKEKGGGIKQYRIPPNTYRTFNFGLSYFDYPAVKKY